MFVRSLLLASLLLPATAHAGFAASSWKKEARKGENFWNASSAVDGRPETAWAVDPEQKNEGQWIQIDTPSGDVDKIAMVIGWDTDENNFFDYARVKKVRVEVFSTAIGTDDKQVLEHELTFEDKRGWQILDVPDAKVGGEMGGGRVRITILETYPGKDYPSLVMSDVRVHLKEFPAETLQVKTLPVDPVDAHDGSFLDDGKDTTFYATNAKTCAFDLTASGYQIASFGILSDKTGYARPKTVKIRANEIELTTTLEDKGGWQWVLLPVVAGYTGSVWGTIKVEVLDTYDGNGLGINEVKLNAATIEDI